MYDGVSTPSCGGTKDCTTDREAVAVSPIETQLQFLMRRADDLQNQLAQSTKEYPLERDHLSSLVHSFLSSTRPLFTYLESRARTRLTQAPPGPLPSSSISSSTSKFLELSQVLCERLEQLVLNYAKHGLLSVDESRSDSVSHLYVGQFVIDRLKVSAFRYHVATPFLSRGGGARPGLYKRMRWNVERLSDDRLHPHHLLHCFHRHQRQQGEEGEGEERQLETGDDTEYFFMCYEDAPPGLGGREGEGLDPSDPAARSWSIGRWVQTFPDPDTEDIYDWILCEVPQARYLQLVSLGSEEPSLRHATDCLLGMLFPHPTGGNDQEPDSDRQGWGY